MRIKDTRGEIYEHGSCDEGYGFGIGCGFGGFGGFYGYGESSGYGSPLYRSSGCGRGFLNGRGEGEIEWA